MYRYISLSCKTKEINSGRLFMRFHETVTKLNIICKNALFFGVIWNFFFLGGHLASIAPFLLPKCQSDIQPFCACFLLGKDTRPLKRTHAFRFAYYTNVCISTNNQSLQALFCILHTSLISTLHLRILFDTAIRFTKGAL